MNNSTLLFIFLFSIQLFAQKPALLIPAERESFILNKYNTNEETWLYLQNRANAYLSLPNNAYGAGEKASALALAYKVSGNTAYRNKAIEMFMDFYINGNFNYEGRNEMRWHSAYAFMTFTWLYNEWSAQDKTQIIDRFNVWANYWIIHSEPNGSAHFRIGDSDHITFLAEFYLMLAVCLENESATTTIENLNVPLYEAVIVTSGGHTVATSDILFSKSDWILDSMVINQYMNQWMKGGFWSEGNDYSPGTMEHWMRTYLINNEIRNIPFPNTYFEDVLYTTIHTTFPAFNGIFQNRDVEQVATYGDYRPPSKDYRYNMMLHLLEIQTNSNIRALGQNWLNTVKINEADAPPSNSGYTGIWRLLFEDVSAPEISPQDYNLNTTFIAEGEGFVATRSSWNQDANLLYFLNSKNYVDHEHADALTFDIVHKNAVITKEMTGYRLNATTSPPFISTAHNTLLMENESPDGSSNPMGRAEGNGINRIIASTNDYTYIEADATKVYNRGEGYQPDIYTDFVVRKLVFMKNLNFVVVFDNIIIKPEASPRWTKYIQHFQDEPILNNSVYSASKDGSSFFLKNLYPQNAIVSKIDESILWQNETILEVPLNQRKWHLSITNPDSPDDSKYLNILYFNDDTVTQMPTSILLHQEESNILSNNVIGTHIYNDNTDDLIILFKNTPDETAIQNTVTYTVNTANNSNHFIYGVDSQQNYDIETSVNNSMITINVLPGNTISPTENGVLNFSISNEILSIENNNLNDYISIYPNPTSNTFTIDLKNEIFKKAIIYNKLGQQVKETASNKINISNLLNGVYFVKITSQNGKTGVKKIIKY